MTKEDLLKEYFTEGGRLFRVESMSHLRSCGTVVIKTTIGNLYMPKYSSDVYDTQELEQSSLIKDEGLLAMLKDRIESYVVQLESSLYFSKNVLSKFK